MQQEKQLASASYLQYQFKLLQQRIKASTSQNQQVQYTSDFDNSDIGFIKDSLVEGRSLILSHTSPKPVSFERLIAQFHELKIENMRIIDGIQNMHAFLCEHKQEKEEILFISLFNLRYLDYKPYLIKFLKISQTKLQQKLILYCQHTQQLNVKQIISSFSADKQEGHRMQNRFDDIQLDVPTPFQFRVSDDLLDVLENFLRDQQKQVQKKDAVIFHAPTQQFKKKLFYLTKTKGFSISSSTVYASQKVSQPSQYNKQLSHIYVAENTKALLKQNFDLERVYLVIDFQQDSYTYFNYQRACYYHIEGRLSYNQMCKRANINFGNIGQYVCGNKYHSGEKQFISDQEQRKYYDYGLYCLVMTDLGLLQQLKKEAYHIPEIKFCLQALSGMEIITKDSQLSRKQIMQLARQGINPILGSSILASLASDENKKKSNLLILTHSILTCPNLRNTKQKQQPSSNWHKTGYLESSLDIIIKCLQFAEDKDSLLNLQQIAANFQINLQSYSRIVQQFERVKKLFKCEDFKWEGQLHQDEFHQLLEELITIFKPAVGTFSGSRRLGYLFKGLNKGMLAHRQCLMSYFNQKPNFVFATKVQVDTNNQSPLILDCNYVRDDVLISTYGCLPTLSKQSFGQCEIQFHNISTAVFSHLSKFNGLQMDIFQNQNFCSIEANSELNIITIQCSKQKQNDIKQKFTKVLNDIQLMFKKQTKSFKQSALLKVVLSAGGQIDEFVTIQKQKANQVMEMGLLKNLAPTVGIQELKELFDEFVQLKDIKIVPNAETNQAILYFYSADDFRKFNQYFSGCNYYDYCMIVQPYVQVTRTIDKENYLLFQWNVWKSTGEALMQFENYQQAKSALANFKCLAGEKAKVEHKATMIYASKLDQKVNEKDLQSWVSGLGTILNIQVRRFAPSTKIYQDISIKSIISSSNPQQALTCTVGKIMKGKNGHRSCQVKGLNKDKMNELFFILNEVQGLAGNGKLYVTPVFTYPISLPEPDEGYAKVYEDIIKDFSKQLGRFVPLETQVVKDPLKWTIIIKTNSQEQIQIIEKVMPARLIGKALNIDCKESSLLFTELAIKNFEKLEKKLPVKIIADFLDKKIKVLCKPSTFSLIQKQINTQMMESFVYPLTLYQKAYTYIQKNIQQIAAEEIKNGLKYRFQIITRTLKLQGNLFLLQKTRQKINKSLSKLKENIQQGNATMDGICGLCCQEFKNPFKLQGCGHTFCYDCLKDSIGFVVQDITLYPIKCPQCMQKIWISDLNCFLQNKIWAQILKTSVNHFIFTHPGEYMYCFTAGCTFICNIKYKSSYSCPQCKKSYCLSCRNMFHPGMTCHQARYGSDRLFTQYMSTVGGRTCANKSCKAPIERISGCFKVQCSRCKKCMCFKCPPNSMIAYDTPEQTYNHLNKLHGGCF